MSLFSMGVNSLEVSEERLQMAHLEFESLTALFDRYDGYMLYRNVYIMY